MRRRDFMALIVGAAVLRAAVSLAQQPERIRRVGVLTTENNQAGRSVDAALAQALGSFGWAEGKNIRTEYRFVGANPALFKTYARELVGLSPDVIVAGGTPAVAALRAQTRTIPIVFVFVGDPIGQGFVQSLARPGGNITGFTAPDLAMTGKWLQLLKEIAPTTTRVTEIFNPETAPPAALLSPPLQAAAPSLGITAMLAPVHDDDGIEQAIAALAREPGGALAVVPIGLNDAHHRAVIVAAASRHRLPMIGGAQFTREGGLLSYWIDPIDQFMRAAPYLDRILKGTSPADLPVQQPTKFELAVNLKTAKAFGLTVPQSILVAADEAIE